jgi:hypothetical protein
MSFITSTSTLNKLPHTKVQYLPSIRDPKSHNLLSHNGTVLSCKFLVFLWPESGNLRAGIHPLLNLVLL